MKTIFVKRKKRYFWVLIFFPSEKHASRFPFTLALLANGLDNQSRTKSKLLIISYARLSQFYLKAGTIQVKISEFLICAKYLAIKQLHIRKPAVYCFTILAAIALKKLTGLSPVPVVS